MFLGVVLLEETGVDDDVAAVDLLADPGVDDHFLGGLVHREELA